MEKHQQSEAAPLQGSVGEGLAELSAPATTSAIGRKSSTLWMLGLAFLAFAAHVSALGARFVFDDSFIEQSGKASWSNIPGFFTTNQSVVFGSNFYRPISSVWIEACLALFGTRPMAWHLTSILVHVACTLLVFRLALVVVEDFSIAWVAAALFGVHPAHVEAISWVSALGDPVWTLFALLSVLAYLSWMQHGKLNWWIVSFVTGTIAIFTKETAVILPFVLLATVLALRSRSKPGLPVIAATAPLFASAILFLGLRQKVLGSFGHSLAGISSAQMVFTWPSALLFYLRHMFWPSVVVPFYPLSLVNTWKSQEFFAALAGLIVICAVLVYLLWRASGWRNVYVCLAWILCPLAPVLYLKALVPLELVHDRFLYAPLVGFCIAAALVLRWLTKRIEAKVQVKAYPLVAFALIFLFGIETVNQMLWWQNNKTLFTRALTVTPGSAKALINLGVAIVAENPNAQPIPLFQRALQIDPQEPTALFYMGRLAWMNGDEAAAEIYLKKALSVSPTYDMWMHVASVEIRMNHLEYAEVAARQSIKMKPSGAGVHTALGAVLLAKGNREDAAREFRTELQNFPQSEPALAGLALAIGNPPR